LKISPWDPYLTEVVDGTEISVNLPLTLSLFHTVFNIINTLIFIPFVTQFATLVEKLVKPKKTDMSKEYKLQYISTGLQDTAQLNILEARIETTKMAEVTDEMFQTFLEVYRNPNKKLGNKVERIKESEELTDQMQEEITKYLAQLSAENLTDQNVKNLNAMMRIINELESIGDSCYKLSLIAQKKYDNKMKFHEKSMEEFNDFVGLISESMQLYKEKMNEHLERRVLELAFKLEKEINNLRDNLKESVQRRLQAGGDVKSELLYLELLKHLEHIGDNSLNISQALRQIY
jgi:phosphate:Na+ symporter